MGQKVHPTGIRLGIVKKHASTWYASPKDYASNLLADLKVREYLPVLPFTPLVRAL